MPAGRPTEYTPAILKKAQKYLDECEDEEVQVVKQSGNNKSGGYEMFDSRLKVKLPSIEGLSRYLNVSRDSLYEWSSKHVEFSDILEDVRAEQAQRLINNGLSGDYNSTITKLMLSKHGYSDKTELTGANGEAIQLEWLSKSSTNRGNGPKDSTPA